MTRIANARAIAKAVLWSALVFLVCILFSGPLAAQQITSARTPKEPSEELSLPAPAESPKATLSQFAWLAGHWQGQWGPRLAQQMWMPPQSGTMAGVFQLSEDTQTLVVELYTIVSTPRGVELRIRHFTPSLTAWEKSPALLTLKSVDSKSILFENADNGQPKNWQMRRTGADTFVARFEIVREKGQQQVAEIVYHRQPASASNR